MVIGVRKQHPPVRRAVLVGVLVMLSAVLVGRVSPAAGQGATSTAAVTAPVTIRVSVAHRQREGGRQSGTVWVSDDGRFAVFASLSRFVPGDTNGTVDVYRRD